MKEEEMGDMTGHQDSQRCAGKGTVSTEAPAPTLRAAFLSAQAFQRARPVCPRGLGPSLFISPCSLAGNGRFRENLSLAMGSTTPGS